MAERLLDELYAPPALDKTGTRNVDSDTIHRVGSPSQAYTALAILQFSDVRSLAGPLTEYGL